MIQPNASFIESQLEEIFQQIFDDPLLEIRRELSPGSMDSWDSVATVQIVMAIDESFGIRLSVDEVAGMDSAGYIIDLLTNKLSHT